MSGSVVSQILSVAQHVGEIVSGRQVEADLHGAVDLDGQTRPDIEHSPSLGVRPDAEACGHEPIIARRATSEDRSA